MILTLSCYLNIDCLYSQLSKASLYTLFILLDDSATSIGAFTIIIIIVVGYLSTHLYNYSYLEFEYCAVWSKK